MDELQQYGAGGRRAYEAAFYEHECIDCRFCVRDSFAESVKDERGYCRDCEEFVFVRDPACGAFEAR